MTAVRSKLGAVVALVLVVALAGVTVWQVEAVREDHRQDKAQQQAIRLAEDQVVDLTTLDSATVKDKIDSMTRRTSGSFKQELTGITQAFVAAVTKSNITAKGQIDSAALASYKKDDAKVIVASTAQVTDGADAQPVTRTYRMKVTLQRSGGTWLIDGMEFVP
jgi:Mce-associated membrane protein